jgi:hypothetical protein
MRMRLYLIGVCLLLVPIAVAAIAPHSRMREVVFDPVIWLIATLAAGCFFMLAGRYGRKLRSGFWVNTGRLLLYLSGLSLLLPSTYGADESVLALDYLLRPDHRNQWSPLWVMGLYVKVFLACGAIALLVAAGRIGLETTTPSE